MPNACPTPSATTRAGADCDEGQKIVFAPVRARHAFEELPSVQDADAVQEHDKADERYRPRDLRFRHQPADRETDEQNGPDAERKAEDVDLSDQIAEADREEYREDRLGSDDVAGKVQHGKISGFGQSAVG